MAATEKQLYNGGATGRLYTDRRDFYMSPQMTKELWGAVTPYTTIVSNKRLDGGLKDPMFKGFEHRSKWPEQYFQTSSVVTIAADNAPDTIAVKAGSIVGLEGAGGNYAYNSWVPLELEVWDSTLTTRRGVLLVTAVTGSGSSANLSVKNAGSSSITTAANDYLFVVGNAQGEGTDSPEPWADDLGIFWNQTQIFKTPIQVTGTIYHAALRGYSNELARLRMEKNKEHKIQKEKAFLYGTSPIGIGQSGDTFMDGKLTDANGNVVRTTYGIISALMDYGTTSGADQNKFTIAEATYNYSNLVDDMEKVFYYEPEAGYKYALCGPGAMSYWSKMDGTNFFAGKSNWLVNVSEEKRDGLGFNFKYLETPHGVLKLVKAPVMKNPSPYNKFMVVISDENLSYKQYRPMKFQANIKTDNAFDGIKDQYMSDEGVALGLLESHKLFQIT